VLNTTASGKPPAAVLVVDNEVPLRNLLSRVLADAGFGVVEAEHGDDALRRVRRLLMPVLFITGRGNEDHRVGVCLETCGEVLRKHLLRICSWNAWHPYWLQDVMSDDQCVR
jgi:hypothetical protein